MHDNYILKYIVDIEKKDLIIETCDSTEGKHKKIHFMEVLTHSFKSILDCNIILDVQECELSSFVKDNQSELTKMKCYAWPIDYNTEQDLIDFLKTNNYKYVRIDSSYGMYGWVIAKSYIID